MSPITPAAATASSRGAAAASSGVRPSSDGMDTSPIPSTSTNATLLLLGPRAAAAAAIAAENSFALLSSSTTLLSNCCSGEQAELSGDRTGFGRARSPGPKPVSDPVGSVTTRADRARTPRARHLPNLQRLALASPPPPSPPPIPLAAGDHRGSAAARWGSRTLSSSLSAPRPPASVPVLLPGDLYPWNLACDAGAARGGGGAAGEGFYGDRGGAQPIDLDISKDFSGCFFRPRRPPRIRLLQVGGCYSKMVCMPGHFKMASVLKLVMMENHATPDEMMNEKSTAQILHKQLFDAHEPNLLDEDDMHIFGSKPMADPLDLVRCNTCKKPVKASQYAAHAERCSSGKVNTNDLMSLDDDAGPKKAPKKGRKIKWTSNGNQKVHIKVKAKSQHENKNIVNGFELNNGNVNKLQPLDLTANQRLKTSVDKASFTNASESRFRDAPVPLATKMYHSQGNYRLRLELGQLYRKSCAEQSGSYTTPNSSQENGLVVSQISPDNSALHGPQKSFVPQIKYLDQLLPSTPESCSGNPQLPSSGSNRLQGTKSHSHRTDSQVSIVRNEMAGSRYKKAANSHSKGTGNKKTQQQLSGSVAVIKSSVK